MCKLKFNIYGSTGTVKVKANLEIITYCYCTGEFDFFSGYFTRTGWNKSDGLPSLDFKEKTMS